MRTSELSFLEQVLDELEAASRDPSVDSGFYRRALQQLATVGNFKTASICLPASGQRWVELASFGDSSTGLLAILEQRLPFPADVSTTLTISSSDQSQPTWYVVPLRTHSYSKGCMAVAIAESVSAVESNSIVELVRAFAEIIATRQASELETFLDRDWERASKIGGRLSVCHSEQEAASILVHGLAELLRAARVTLVRKNKTVGMRTLAISSVASFSEKSETIRNLESLARHVLRQRKPLLKRPSEEQIASPQEKPDSAISENGTFKSLLALQFTPHSDHVLILEFASSNELVASVSILGHILPHLGLVWEQHRRWLSIPRLLRKRLTPTASIFQPWGNLGLRLAFFAIICLSAWFGLQVPYPLLIESEGTYEPVVRRMVFATDDGFIDELAVRDGNQVVEGQLLTTIHAPQIDLQIQETKGQIAALNEEISGLKIAVDRKTTSDDEYLEEQRKQASAIELLQLRRENAEKSLGLMEKLRERLVVRSPISGQVVAEHLDETLPQKPVRKGEPLMTVADISGSWHLRLRVAEKDAGYLRTHFAQSNSGQASPKIEFVFDSSPDSKRVAKLEWISPQVENKGEQGCFVEIRALPIDMGEAEPKHAGAGVRAYFHCGDQPLWFVWCRPLIEAAQRRLWLQDKD